MAKKKAKAKLVFDLTVSANLLVPQNAEKDFLADDKRGELALRVEYVIDGVCHSYNIYRNHFSEGGYSVERVNDENYRLVIQGTAIFELSAEQVKDHRESFGGDGELAGSVTFLYAYDHNLSDFYIDGDEDKNLSAGTWKVIE